MLRQKAKDLTIKFYHLLTSSWKIIAILCVSFIFLYFPLGGFLINDIDTNTQYEITEQKTTSSTVDMASYIINREVHEKLWTPNLPFIFPSFFLDNMPSFQLGLMSSVSNVVNLMSHKVEKTISVKENLYLKNAAKLLQYPGTIWMFSPDNSLAPSANSQYKKARKNLIKFNKEFLTGNNIFYKNPSDLRFFMMSISKNLNNSSLNLAKQIREESTSIIDTKADDVFYYNQGKIYGYYLLIKSLGYDYKDIIVENNLYPTWTSLLKALEQGSILAPMIIRNAKLDSSTAPNHLSSLAYYSSRASFLSYKIAQKLPTKGQ